MLENNDKLSFGKVFWVSVRNFGSGTVFESIFGPIVMNECFLTTNDGPETMELKRNPFINGIVF